MCHIFPKIDGTNSSVWLKEDGCLGGGSRNRELSLDKDNAGFLEAVSQDEKLLSYLRLNANHRLFGEWLVPHSFKFYRLDAWRKFYVFDVAIDDGEGFKFLDYETYKTQLEAFGIEYIPAICKVENPRQETLQELLEKNTFLVEDGKGFGEGIVIKNYSYFNKFGRQVWAKLIRNEFKDLHLKVHPTNMHDQGKQCEEEIAKEFLTASLVLKTQAKIITEKGGWSSKCIPQLLNVSFYDLIREEIWEILKRHNFPTIDFKLLRGLCIQQIKTTLPHVFA